MGSWRKDSEAGGVRSSRRRGSLCMSSSSMISLSSRGEALRRRVSNAVLVWVISGYAMGVSRVAFNIGRDGQCPSSECVTGRHIKSIYDRSVTMK
jgi:hypothetical protein